MEHRIRQELHLPFRVFAKTPAEILVRCATKTQKFAANSRIFAPKICAISAPNAAFYVAKLCADSNESCFNVTNSAQRTIGISTRVFREPQPQNCKKYARNPSALGAFALRVRRQTAQCPATNVTNTPLRAAPTSRDFETTPAKFLVRCASKTQEVCSEFANFCTANLRDLCAKRGFLRRQTLH